MQKDWARRLRAVLTFLSPPLKSSIKALLDFSFAFSTRNFFHASLPLSQNEGGGKRNAGLLMAGYDRIHREYQMGDFR